MRRAAVLSIFLTLFAGLSTATVTSADSITYNSNNEFFNGEVFAISVASDQATDKIDITLDQSELEQFASGQVNQDLTIDFTDQSTELRYSTTPSESLRRVETFTPLHERDINTFDSLKTAVRSNCYDLDQDGEADAYTRQYYDVADLSTNYEYFCYQSNKNLGVPAYVDNPDEVFTTKAELKASGKTVQTATISNGDAGQGRTTDLGRHAKVAWNGNLDTGASAPDTSRVLGLYANRYSGSWRVINQESYTTYQDFLTNGGAYQQLVNWAKGSTTGWNAVENINDKAWNAAEVAESSELAYTGTADSSFRQGEFTYDTPDLLWYPMFTVYVDAGPDGYIEVSKPTGEPRITSTSGAEVKELGTSEVSATVRNVGNGEGSFSARVTSCGQGFNFPDTQRTKTVSRGESVSFSFDVSFGSTSTDQREITRSCTIQVQDTGSGDSDRSSVEVTGIQASECDAGDQSASVNENGRYEIYECRDNEQGKFLVTTCAEGEQAVPQGNNKYACEEAGDTTGGGSDGGLELPFPFGGVGDDRPTGFLGQIHLALSMIAGIVLSVLGYKTGRFVDGERDINGSFQPFKRRSIDRVMRGRFIAGLLGAVVGFASGTLIALSIPLLVQVIVIGGVGYLNFRFR